MFLAIPRAFSPRFKSSCRRKTSRRLPTSPRLRGEVAARLVTAWGYRSIDGGRSSRREPLTPTLSPQEAGRGEREPRDDNLDFVIPSISAISSAVSFHAMASTFCSICSSRVAPAITLETWGRDGEPGEGQFQHRVAAFRGEGLQFFDDVFVARGDVAVPQGGHFENAYRLAPHNRARICRSIARSPAGRRARGRDCRPWPPATDPFRCRARRGCIRPGRRRSG